MKTALSFNKVVYSVFEIGSVILVSYVLYRFLGEKMTSLETLFVYGIVGFLLSFKLENKIDRIIVIILALAFLSPMPYGLFALGVYCLYRFSYSGALRIKL